MLYIVATPIGNLEDIADRAKRVLEEVDLIACEDTRVTGRLLRSLHIQTPTTSYHSHSSDAKEQGLIDRLQSGEEIALVSDAGTPTISDPGSRFVRRAIEARIEVTPIPGASAAVAALSISGFRTRPHTFFGFPPTKKGVNAFFDEVNKTPHTVVFYESKHRILKTLGRISPDREIMVGRELTKLHETIYRGTPQEVLEALQSTSSKGEFVVVLAPKIKS